MFAFDALRELWSQLMALRTRRGGALRSET
jgi:hypothetical protein